MWRSIRTSLILFIALTQPAWGMRCGRMLVTEGDPKIQVVRKCGEPDFAESRMEYRSVRLRGSGFQQPGADFETVVPVQIDEWTYNFGPHQLMQKLVFENGRLIRIESLDYGF